MAHPGEDSPAVQVQSLEEEMATHSSTLAWKIPWAEEPGGLQSTGSPRVGHNWATKDTHTTHRRDQPSAGPVSVSAPSPHLGLRVGGAGKPQRVACGEMEAPGGCLRVTQGSWGESSWFPSLAPCPAGRVVTRLRLPPG